MIIIKASSGIATLRKLGVQLSIKELAQANARAINRSLEKARTKVRKEVRTVYNVPTRATTGIDINRAKSNNLHGELYGSTKPLPLDVFSPRQETATTTITVTRRGEQRVKELRRARKNPQGGVSIEVEKNRRETVPYAFMIPGAKPRVFARGEYRMGTQHGFVQRHHRVNKDGNDTPVKPLITMSIYGQILNDEVLQPTAREVEQYYPTRLEHEVMVLVNKIDK